MFLSNVIHRWFQNSTVSASIDTDEAITSIKNSDDILKYTTHTSNRWYDRLARWLMVPGEHLLKPFPVITEAAIRTLDARNLKVWALVRSMLVYVLVCLRMISRDDENRLDWNAEGIPVFARSNDLIAWCCNRFDIYDLIRRDKDTGYFVIDTMYVNDYEQTRTIPRRGAVAYLELTNESGFVCVGWSGSEDDMEGAKVFVDMIIRYMTVLSHAVRSHSLVGGGVTHSTGLNLTEMNDPLRRVLLPTEIGTLNGVGRAATWLMSKYGVFNLTTGFTYAGLQLMISDYMQTKPRMRYISTFGGKQFAPELNLSDEEAGCSPFRELIEWHDHCRALGERAVKQTSMSDDVLRRWVSDAGFGTSPAVDLVAAVYMNLVVHNMQSNTDLTAYVNINGSPDDRYPKLLLTVLAKMTDVVVWPTLALDLSDLAPDAFGGFYESVASIKGRHTRAAGIDISTGL
jgi:hypothetical protein